MAILSKTKACLRIIGDELQPDEISTLLDCKPTREMIKGEPFSWSKSGEPRIAKSGMWRLDAEERVPGDLDDQVIEILGKVTDNLGIWQELSIRYKIDLFCGLFMEDSMEGIGLSGKSMLALGQRGIELDLDMYGPDDENV